MGRIVPARLSPQIRDLKSAVRQSLPYPFQSEQVVLLNLAGLHGWRGAGGRLVVGGESLFTHGSWRYSLPGPVIALCVDCALLLPLSFPYFILGCSELGH